MTLGEQRHVGQPVKGERHRQGTYGSVTSKKGLSSATLSPACSCTAGFRSGWEGETDAWIQDSACCVRETARNSGDSCPGAITGPLPTKSIAVAIISVRRR